MALYKKIIAFFPLAFSEPIFKRLVLYIVTNHFVVSSCALTLSFGLCGL